MKTGYLHIIDSYMGLIRPLPKEVKLELISKITDSLNHASESVKDDSCKALFGAFKSEQSADEIIEDLRASRYTNREIEDL